MKLSRDGWAGLAVLAASLFLFAATIGLQDNPLVPIGPGFYPRIILGITAALAALLVASELFRKSADREPEKEKLNYGLVAVMFAAFGLYCGALPYLGFRIATALYVTASNALLDPPRGAKGWARALVVGLVTSVLVYIAFERYLSVLLPRGRWTGF